MNILIVEDEAIAIDWLKAQLYDMDSTITVVGEVASIKNAVEWLLTMPPPDLAFMDIQLADGLSFEIFAQIHVPNPVIFTTSYDEFALQAFKVHSIDYLLKPINKKDLQRSLVKFKQLQDVYSAQNISDEQNISKQTSGEQKHQKNQRDSNSNITRLVEQLLQTQAPHHASSRLLVQYGNKMQSIDFEEVAFASSEEKLTYITTHTNKRYIKNLSLDELEKILPKHTFFRINRQFIVHINAVESIHTHPSGKLKVHLIPPPKSATEVGRDTFVSRERLSDFKAWLGK
jgi:two-component system response regulator LytT